MPPYLRNTLNWMAFYGKTDNPNSANTGNPAAYSIVTGCHATDNPTACCNDANPAACYPTGVTGCGTDSSALTATCYDATKPYPGTAGNSIAGFQASSNDGEPDGNNANYGERLNFPYSGSHFGCCGFNQPTQNLVNFFRVDASGLPLALSDAAHWNANNDNFTADNKAPVDPRLDWTVGRDGVPYKDWGLYSTTDGWVRDVENGGPYSPKKNAHEKASGAESNVGWQNTQLNSVHIHIFRYADLLLLLAEADVETGNLEGARKIVNDIRARAAVAVQGPGTSSADMAVPINSPSITWATYRVGQYPAFPGQAYARDAVRAERRLELAMEGQRLFDLRRWGIADAALNGYVNGIGGGAEKARRLYLSTAEPFAARHKWYPIPDLQIQLSQSNGQSNLRQNSGW